MLCLALFARVNGNNGESTSAAELGDEEDDRPTINAIITTDQPIITGSLATTNLITSGVR